MTVLRSVVVRVLATYLKSIRSTSALSHWLTPEGEFGTSSLRS